MGIRLATVVLLATVLAGCSVAHAGSTDKLARHRKQLKVLRLRIEHIQQHLNADRSRRSSLSRRLEAVEKSIAAASKKLHRVDGRLHQQAVRLAGLESREKKRRSELRADRAALGRQIRSAYMAGRDPRLKMLLNQQNPATLGRMLVYYDYFNAARTQRIQTLTHRLQALRRLQQQVTREKVRLSALRQKQSRSLADLKSTRHQRSALLQRINRRIHTRHQKLQRMLADEHQLQALIQSLQGALADIPGSIPPGVPFGRLRGKLPWPVQGTIVKHYGTPRRYGQLRWQGVLIRAKRGTPVKAISGARVAFANWLPHYGLTIILEHGNGYLSLYGHNQALYKGVGDRVKAGETIATVGDTGGESQPALYFEIRKGKKPLNPQKWCRLETASK